LLCACASARPLPTHAPPPWTSDESVWVDPHTEAQFGAGAFMEAAVKNLTAELLRDGFQSGRSDDPATLVIRLNEDSNNRTGTFHFTLWRRGNRVGQVTVTSDELPCWLSFAANVDAKNAQCLGRAGANLIEDAPELAAVHQKPATPAAGAGPQISGRLAVLDLRNETSDLQPKDVRYFTDVIRAAVLRLRPQLEVMTRENLLVLLKSTGNDELDESANQAVAQLLGSAP